MYTLVKPIATRNELLKRKIRIFTSSQFALLFQLSQSQAKYFLDRFVEEELLARLKRGLYALKTDPPIEQEIANALYKPSYISFDYALAYYNLIPEMVYEVTSATTKPTRLFTTETLAFGYYTIKTGAFTGYILKQEGERRFYIAEPEKAVVDYLYVLTLGQRGILGKRTINDRLQITTLNKEKIRAYAKLFARPQLERLTGEIIKESI